MTIFMQSFSGRKIDLLNPVPEDVDFCEIAETLARINLYNGASFYPVSVAQHTLIASEACAPSLIPWVLLHDAHKARTGNMPIEQTEAIAHILEQTSHCGLALHGAMRILKQRHSMAIHAAAGIKMPDYRQRQAIELANLAAVQTELRDFMHTFGAASMAGKPILPLRKVYSPQQMHDIADALFAKFCFHLPALADPKEGGWESKACANA